MEMQAINITNITDAFKDFLEVHELKTTAIANLAGIGTKPALPQFVDTNSDWSDAIAARNTWETNKKTYTEQVNSYTDNARQLELSVINLLPPNTYVRVDATGGPDYYWIGYNTNTTPGYQQYLRFLDQDAQPGTPLTENMDA